MTVDERFNALQGKLQQLVKEQARLRKEHAELTEALTRAEAERNTLATQVQELVQLVGILKLAAGNLDDKDKKEFEKQINRFVRDLDKTIAYLGTI
ncbi:hypothetical protein [Flaviaesturariibacter amylovorans]|uniref:Mobilization protein n=1 Tax=Flaviaesturariibacter amylovorans TaxID=1084520 RepID=A0ABP8H9D7_9BACT